MPTDYRGAHATVSEALALLDENFDFDIARDEDPEWPSRLEGQAVLALRAFRNELASLGRPADSSAAADEH